MPAALKRLLNKRAPLRQQSENICKDIQLNSASLDLATLQGHKLTLEESLITLAAYNDEINEFYEEDDTKDDLFIQQEWALCLDYETKIRKALSIIKVCSDALVNTGSNNNSSISNNSILSVTAQATMKFPEVPLPEFSGKETESLEDFLANFEATIQQTNANPFQKFLLLKKSLSGDAAKLIAAITVSNDAFDRSKALLERAYEPTVKKKFKALESFINLKMEFSDHVYDHYSRLQNLFEAYDRVQIDNATIKQFFAWRSFTAPLQESFITVTGKYKPDLNEIEQFKFDAAERYNDRQKKFNNRRSFSSNATKDHKSEHDKTVKSKEKSSSYAANVPGQDKSSKPDWCRLCQGTGSDTKHKVVQCEKFPSVKAKIDRIHQLKGCIKCGYSNHQKDSCKFSFVKKCRHCEGSHMSWLCLKGNSVNVASDTGHPNDEESVDETGADSCHSEPESDSELANMCNVEVHNAGLASNSILPTCELTINGAKFRCMCDSGCQKNFITKALIKRAKIKTKNSVDITINGFNSSKKYKADLANVPFEYGGKKFIIEAVVLPKIDAGFMADGLSAIANEFIDKGYKMADPFFSHSAKSLLGY